MEYKKHLFKALQLVCLLVFLISCKNIDTVTENKKSHPSHIYKYVAIDSSRLDYFQADYVPVYSDIYHRDGTRRFNLTVTLSIRNTSKVDSTYILSVNYYDSYGKLLKEYIDRTILLFPLESIEFVVDENEIKGGAGANFIVDWGTNNYSNQLLIQAIMIGTEGQQGISFITDSKNIDSSAK